MVDVSWNALVDAEFKGRLNKTDSICARCGKLSNVCQVVVTTLAFGSVAVAVKANGELAATVLSPMAARIGGALGVVRLATLE